MDIDDSGINVNEMLIHNDSMNIESEHDDSKIDEPSDSVSHVNKSKAGRKKANYMNHLQKQRNGLWDGQDPWNFAILMVMIWT